MGGLSAHYKEGVAEIHGGNADEMDLPGKYHCRTALLMERVPRHGFIRWTGKLDGYCRHGLHRDLCHGAGLLHDSFCHAVPEGYGGKYLYEHPTRSGFTGGHCHRTGYPDVG